MYQRNEREREIEKLVPTIVNMLGHQLQSGFHLIVLLYLYTLVYLQRNSESLFNLTEKKYNRKKNKQ